MQETFLVLFTAHILGDFVFQTNRTAETKGDSLRGILVHSILVTLITILVAGYFAVSWGMLVYAGVFAAHFLIDAIKEQFGKDGAYTLLVDQAGHIATLIFISCLIPDVAARSIWMKVFPNFYLPVLIFIGGLATSVFAGAVLVSKSTLQLTDQIDNSKLNGLQNGGCYIGCLERGLIFLFVWIGQTNGVGFLFAAKSILRFGEIKDTENRKEAEYIIIGTFLSFGWALLISYLTLQALKL